MQSFFFVCQILDGNINFAHQNILAIYSFLESIWLSEVKKFKAYFIWENKGGGWEPKFEKNNYYEAGEQIRRMLDNPNIKAPRREFGEVRAYLERRYLTQGRIDNSKAGIKDMISFKAKRIQEITGETDTKLNKLHAEEYVRMFYENIIPAVVEDDSERILMTLKAFQFSKEPEHRYSIINCFENSIGYLFSESCYCSGNLGEVRTNNTGITYRQCSNWKFLA